MQVNEIVVGLRDNHWFMTDPCDRLKEARKKAGFASAAEAAARFGWAYSTYAGHENGNSGFKYETAAAYGTAFKVDPAWILYGTARDGGIDLRTGGVPTQLKTVEPKVSITGSREDESLVPVYDIQASAGFGLFVPDQEEIVEMLSFPRNYLERIANRSSAKDLVIISAKGDSMLPTIASGDVVMVDVSKRDWGYDGLFVIRDGDGALLIKRLARSGRRGHVTIISDNSRLYPAVEAPANEIEIVGKVLWMGVKV